MNVVYPNCQEPLERKCHGKSLIACLGIEEIAPVRLFREKSLCENCKGDPEKVRVKAIETMIMYFLLTKKVEGYSLLAIAKKLREMIGEEALRIILRKAIIEYRRRDIKRIEEIINIAEELKL